MNTQPPVLATLFAKIPTEKIGFLKFILEGYDGLAVLTTADRDTGLVSLHYFPACRDDLVAVLESVQKNLT